MCHSSCCRSIIFILIIGGIQAGLMGIARFDAFSYLGSLLSIPWLSQALYITVGVAACYLAVSLLLHPEHKK